MKKLLSFLIVAFLLHQGVLAGEKKVESKPAGEVGRVQPIIGEKQLGRKITLVGIAQNAKLGPVVLVGQQPVYLFKQNDWGADLLNQKICVTGILKKFDLPVATKVDGVWSAGVSEPGKAYRLEKVKWKRVESEIP